MICRTLYEHSHVLISVRKPAVYTAVLINLYKLYNLCLHFVWRHTDHIVAHSQLLCRSSNCPYRYVNYFGGGVCQFIIMICST